MSDLGRQYANGQVIVRQGERGDCMYVIQSGQVEAIAEVDGREAHVRTLGAGDFFGEMSLIGTEARSCTIRALGDARVLTIDKNGFLRGIQEDPSLAFRVLQVMAERIQDLTDRLVRQQSGE